MGACYPSRPFRKILVFFFFRREVSCLPNVSLVCVGGWRVEGEEGEGVFFYVNSFTPYLHTKKKKPKLKKKIMLLLYFSLLLGSNNKIPEGPSTSPLPQPSVLENTRLPRSQVSCTRPVKRRPS